MYDRRVDGRVLRFGHLGVLYNDSFVMYDHQTDSYWVHVTGTAYDGPLKGRKLTFLPSTVTAWADWKARYPHTTVLPGRRRDSFMGTYDGFAKERGLGISVVVRFRAKLYPLPELARTPVVNDRFEGEPILVAYVRGARTATAWGRRVQGRTLTFARAEARDRFGDPLLRDAETGSLWSWLTGEAVQGPLQGALLPQLTYNPILVDRFRVFYPGAPEYPGSP